MVEMVHCTCGRQGMRRPCAKSRWSYRVAWLGIKVMRLKDAVQECMRIMSVDDDLRSHVAA